MIHSLIVNQIRSKCSRNDIPYNTLTHTLTNNYQLRKLNNVLTRIVTKYVFGVHPKNNIELMSK